jgi:hypothetical protein
LNLRTRFRTSIDQELDGRADPALQDCSDREAAQEQVSRKVVLGALYRLARGDNLLHEAVMLNLVKAAEIRISNSKPTSTSKTMEGIPVCFLRADTVISRW